MTMNTHKIASLAFAGILGLNLNFGGAVRNFEKREVATGEGINARIETAVQKFKNSRAEFTGAVTLIGTNSVTVSENGQSVLVDIGPKTHIRRKFWGEGKLTEISVGDSVQVVGRWTSDAKTEITAVLIRDTSIQKRKGAFFGTVKSINGNTFVVTTIHRDDETVTIDSTTKIVNRKEGVLTSSDIKVGDRIRVKGMWDSANKTITEVVEIKDFSLPPKASPQPTP